MSAVRHPVLVDVPTVRFRVLGIPAPQGSKKAFVVGHRAVITEDNKPRHATWRDAVATAAAREVADLAGPLDGPLQLGVTFRYPMPASRPAWIRKLRTVPHQRGDDLDKLLRAVGDALQAAGLIVDDARIARTIADKIEIDPTVPDGWTGAEISIGPLLVATGVTPRDVGTLDFTATAT